MDNTREKHQLNSATGANRCCIIIMVRHLKKKKKVVNKQEVGLKPSQSASSGRPQAPFGTKEKTLDNIICISGNYLQEHFKKKDTVSLHTNNKTNQKSPGNIEVLLVQILSLQLSALRGEKIRELKNI